MGASVGVGVKRVQESRFDVAYVIAASTRERASSGALYLFANGGHICDVYCVCVPTVVAAYIADSFDRVSVGFYLLSYSFGFRRSAAIFVKVICYRLYFVPTQSLVMVCVQICYVFYVGTV